jgi:hypothetical protein
MKSPSTTPIQYISTSIFHASSGLTDLSIQRGFCRIRQDKGVSPADRSSA